MQVQNMVQDVAPLSERFTLVVITHNRKAYLRRTMEYYKGFAGKVLVLDSSPEGDERLAADYPAADYRHLPQFAYSGLQDKLNYGVAQVTTPYMAFAADDDFLLFDALNESVDFLQANPDYGLCHGYGIMYSAHANEVQYFRRDRRVCEDYCSEQAGERVMEFMSQFLPPFYGVTRTELLQQWFSQLPAGVSFEWQEIGHAIYLLACAKARILPIPYAVREVNSGGSQHNTNVLTVLLYNDAKSVAQREQFAELLASLPTGLEGSAAERKQLLLDSFQAMGDCLQSGRSLEGVRIFRSKWLESTMAPVRSFGERQFVEMPFYNQKVFDLLTQFEFLIHSMPTSRPQLKQLEGILLKQEELLRVQPNDTEATIRNRLWVALDSNVFNLRVVKRLLQSLAGSDEPQLVAQLQAWVERLEAVPTTHSRTLLDGMPSGRLLNWLDARKPDTLQLKAIAAHLAKHKGGPQFCILLLDLEGDMAKLQATFDSLVASHCKAFKVVVLTAGDLPATTRPQDTVHFVKVTASNYVERLNQLAGQSTADWLLLIRAGDLFTQSGLLRASLELLDASGCRAVAMDEVQRQADGTLSDVFRPGVNLDLLQSVPDLMAGHWLVRREVWADVGGYSVDFAPGLEFDLVLRLIEQGGLAGLAHLAEPLLISEVQEPLEAGLVKRMLTRHLGIRGYRAQIGTEQPGVYQVDYRHAERPLVSILLQAEDNFAELQACLVSVLQRTRYSRYEVLIGDNHNQSEDLTTWLGSLEQQGNRVRVLRTEQRLSPAELSNALSQEARGEYLVLLSADAQVGNANWIDSLVNQAQRPEVGIVGALLVDEQGVTTQAGLILGLNGGVGAAFVGAPKSEAGYLNRLWAEQNYSAVSGACLMVRKELYQALGGLDQEHFAEAFADVDLCLKAADAGYLTVWTPRAQMVHPGILPDHPQAAAALVDKWSARFAQDVAYNQNLALTGKAFTLSAASGVDWAQLLVS